MNTITNTKITVNSDEEAAEFQRLVFMLGCSWGKEPCHEVKHTDARMFRVTENGKLRFTYCRDHYLNDEKWDCEIITLDDLRESVSKMLVEPVMDDTGADQEEHNHITDAVSCLADAADQVDELRSVKITVDSEEEAAEFQRLAFKLGCRWGRPPCHEVKNTHARMFRITDTGLLKYTTDSNWFADQPVDVVTLDDMRRMANTHLSYVAVVPTTSPAEQAIDDMGPNMPSPASSIEKFCGVSRPIVFNTDGIFPQSEAFQRLAFKLGYRWEGDEPFAIKNVADQYILLGSDRIIRSYGKYEEALEPGVATDSTDIASLANHVLNLNDTEITVAYDEKYYTFPATVLIKALADAEYVLSDAPQAVSQ